MKKIEERYTFQLLESIEFHESTTFVKKILEKILYSYETLYSEKLEVEMTLEENFKLIKVLDLFTDILEEITSEEVSMSYFRIRHGRNFIVIQFYEKR